MDPTSVERISSSFLVILVCFPKKEPVVSICFFCGKREKKTSLRIPPPRGIHPKSPRGGAAIKIQQHPFPPSGSNFQSILCGNDGESLVDLIFLFSQMCCALGNNQ